MENKEAVWCTKAILEDYELVQFIGYSGATKTCNFPLTEHDGYEHREEFTYTWFVTRKYRRYMTVYRLLDTTFKPMKKWSRKDQHIMLEALDDGMYHQWKDLEQHFLQLKREAKAK